MEAFIILESRMKNYVEKQKGKIFFRFKKGSYLVILNRLVDWARNVHIVNWVALESGNKGKALRHKCTVVMLKWCVKTFLPCFERGSLA
jgi:hypothetical protein